MESNEGTFVHAPLSIRFLSLLSSSAGDAARRGLQANVSERVNPVAVEMRRWAEQYVCVCVRVLLFLFPPPSLPSFWFGFL